MFKSDSIFPYLQCGALFKWLSEFIYWYGLSQTWMITVMN